MFPWRRRIGRDRIEIAPMRVGHLDEVMAIEEAVFPAPWSRSLYREELAVPRGRVYLVALEAGHVVGFIGVMMVIDEAHITTVAVKESHQGHAIGKTLMYHAIVAALELGAVAATLEVRVSNAHAQALYHQFGFAPAGIRKNYYAEINEDGIVMWAHDLDDDLYRARLDRIAEQIASRSLPLPATTSTQGDR